MTLNSQLTRAALSTGGRAKSKFLSVEASVCNALLEPVISSLDCGRQSAGHCLRRGAYGAWHPRASVRWNGT